MNTSINLLFFIQKMYGVKTGIGETVQGLKRFNQTMNHTSSADFILAFLVSSTMEANVRR